jgi:serine protease
MHRGPRRVVLLALCLSALAGCGGGGGGGGSNGGGNQPPQPPQPPPPTLTFNGQPLNILSGDSTTLTWSSTEATSCTAFGGWTGSRNTAGSEVLAPAQGVHTFMLTCAGQGGSVTRSVQLTVALAPPPTLNLTVSPELASPNEPVTLTWTSTGADSCREGLADRPLQGSLTRPAPNTQSGRSIIEMQCDGRGGSTKVSITLRIRTFSGSAAIPAGIFADSDVNDPDAPFFDNGGSGQPVPSFGLAPGYVNVAGSGPAGRSFQSGDMWDFYRTDTMEPGQIVRLILPTVDVSQPIAERDDADLYLYDVSGNLLDASLGNGAEETLEITAHDVYVVGVKAEHGGFNYLLSLEDPPATLSLGAQRLSASFVPGEAIVTRGPQATTKNAASTQRKPTVDRERRVSVSTELLTEPQTDSTTGSQKQQQRRFGHDAERRLGAKLQRKLATLQHIKQLARTADIGSVSVNRIVEAQATPTDPGYLRQRWHYEAARLPAAWDLTTGSANVTVAVVDSGAFRNHPDLEAKFVDGYDMVDLDANFSDPGGASGYHGTHVLGTVGAIASNGRGGAGVAWGSNLMPLRALEGRSGTMYDILQAVRYAAGLPNDSGLTPARPADIINLSLGARGECTAEEADVYSAVIGAGVTVVAAAGNSSSNVDFTPAVCPGVIGVIATGPGNRLAAYSNFGAPFDLAAPGGDTRVDADADGFLDGVFSTIATGAGASALPGYAAHEGTSMAAPHVAGILALMKSVRPTLTPLEIQQMLDAGQLTDDLGAFGSDELGVGAINAFKAVRAASGVFNVPPRVGVSPGVVDFGNNSSEKSFNIRNAGSGALSITNVESTVPWLTVAPTATDASGLGTYRATASNADLPRGAHHGAIEIESSVGPYTLPVTIIKLTFNIASKVGVVHVHINDAATGALVRSQTVSGSAERSSFLLHDLAVGTYTLTVGTDFNHDGNLCDTGEICGAYPITSFAQPINFDGVAIGLDVPMVVTARGR